MLKLYDKILPFFYLLICALAMTAGGAIGSVEFIIAMVAIQFILGIGLVAEQEKKN